MLSCVNKLSKGKRVQILSLLVEGVSLRSITRLTGVSINTVTKLLVDAGKTCAAYHDRTVRDMETRRVQCDEIWSFCYAKDKNVTTAKAAPSQAGDVWTWTALDSDSKMILAYEVGDRSSATALEFMDNLRARLANRVQITTDGHKAYLEAVEGAFGGDVDFAQLVKLYGKSASKKSSEHKYSPSECAFSKKIENHVYHLDLYYAYYNFIRVHKTLGMTPAMAAGLADTAYEWEWLVDLMEARAMKPVRPKDYESHRTNSD